MKSNSVTPCTSGASAGGGWLQGQLTKENAPEAALERKKHHSSCVMLTLSVSAESTQHGWGCWCRRTTRCIAHFGDWFCCVLTRRLFPDSFSHPRVIGRCAWRAFRACSSCADARPRGPVCGPPPARPSRVTDQSSLKLGRRAITTNISLPWGCSGR